MKERVLKYIKDHNLIEKNDKILVAVSGGPDSISILNILMSAKEELGVEINVAHINHMIRKDAEADRNYVLEYCKKCNMQFFDIKVDVTKISKQEKISIEEAGRNERYKFFEKICIENDINKVVLGHNKNDVAETLIMNILRGSGVQGLKSIPNKNGRYVRPLLDTDRKDIEKYCIDNNLNPRIDSTNSDNTYTRNKIRNIVIPYIKDEFNPNIIETLARLSNIVKDEQEYMEKEVEKVYNDVVLEQKEEYIMIDSKKINEENVAINNRLILYIIKKLFGNTKEIEKKNIEDICKLIFNNIGNKFLMPNKNIKVAINKGIVSFMIVKQ